MIINCRNPEGGAPSAKRRALPSHERRAICFFAFSFFSARVVLVCPTKKGSPVFGTSLFYGGDDQKLPKPLKGPPRQGVGLRPRTNDARYVFFSAFSFFSARVVLVCLRQRKTGSPFFGLPVSVGGDDQTRTDYLYVANVSLYRVSYIPIFESFIIIQHFIKIFNRFRAFLEKNFSVSFFLGRMPGKDCLA